MKAMTWDRRWPLLLVCVAGCSSGLDRGGPTGKGGSAGAGRGGAVGTGGGTGGAGLQCPQPPPTNDPACHPDDGNIQSATGTAVTPTSGDCTAGLRCDFWVGESTGCDQAIGVHPYICCPFVFPPYARGPGGAVLPLHSSFLPGSTLDACPTPIAGQNPACALPLANPCTVDGLECTFETSSGGGVDGGCGFCHDDNIRCCAGVWVYGDTCPADAGTD